MTRRNYDWLWKNLRTLPKIKIFLWQSSLNKINTRARLSQLRISDSPLCPDCNLPEDILLIFRDCRIARQLLGFFNPINLKLKNPFYITTDILTWIKENYGSAENLNQFAPWSVLFSFACWHLWLEQNSRYHRDTNHDYIPSLHPTIVLSHVYEYLFIGPIFSLDLPNRMNLVPVSWTTPPPPYIKLNTGGIGGVFRNFEGKWLLGFTKYYPTLTNLQAEVLAIKEGLQIASHRGYTHLIIESDSTAALSLLSENSNERMKLIVQDCRYLMQTMVSVKLQHIFREGNRIADRLATMGRISNNMQLQLMETAPKS